MTDRAIVVLFAIAFASPCYGEVIFAGETVPLFGTSLVDEPQFGGPLALVEGTGNPAMAVVPFAAPGGEYSGLIELSVHESPSGALASWYRIVEFTDDGTGYEIEGLETEPHFDLFEPIEADWLLDMPGDIAPVSGSWGGSGTGVGFDYAICVTSGVTSRTMVVYNDTNDLVADLAHYGAFVSVSDPFGNITAAPFMTYLSFVPGPSGLFVFALAGACARRRRGVAWGRSTPRGLHVRRPRS